MQTEDAVREITLVACDCGFSICCPDLQTAARIQAVFGGLAVPPSAESMVQRRYRIERQPNVGFLVSDGLTSIRLNDTDRLLFHLDKDVTLTLQRHRPDLFFLHGAAIACAGRVAVLSALSGTGKSTLTLASLDQGFEYLSDELAPIDLQRLTVHPYPHALCLKGPVFPLIALPAGTLEQGQRFRVPVKVLPQVSGRKPLPLAAVMFLRRDGERFSGLRPVTQASAVARLMESALNPLAHPGGGLDAALALGQAVPCFELDICDLGAAIVAIRSCLSGAEVRVSEFVALN